MDVFIFLGTIFHLYGKSLPCIELDYQFYCCMTWEFSLVQLGGSAPCSTDGKADSAAA
jgi:hypothetical protein